MLPVRHRALAEYDGVAYPEKKFRLEERPVGIEPTRPPWQGSRLPLHHGRLKIRLRSEGLEPSPVRLKAEDAATNTSISCGRQRPDDHCLLNTPYRIRTGVTGLKSQHPEPLDERGLIAYEKIQPVGRCCRNIVAALLGPAYFFPQVVT